MRPHILLLAGLTLPVALTPIAHAQVTLDLKALDQGGAPQGGAPGGAAPPQAPRRASTTPKAHPAPVRRAARVAPNKPAAAPAHAQVKPEIPGPSAPAATLPVTPPATVSLPPIVIQPPAAKPEPPPAPPVSADAGGGLEPIAGGVRVLFTPARTDLAPTSEAGIRSYLEAVPKTPTTSFNVTAYAAGPPDDPSTPRRLSLSRALAVRSVLMAEGVPSAQIYLRALGSNSTGGPTDRVDVTALGTNGPPARAPEAGK